MSPLRGLAIKLLTSMKSGWETVIGLEIHAQLSTESKIFCGWSTRFGDEPNANTCPVCLSLPGARRAFARIVTEPDFGRWWQAYDYVNYVRQALQWVGASEADMEKGSLRCEANVSVRRVGDEKFGTKVELKNLNTVRFMQRAIEFEIERQIELIESGGRVVQETRLWDERNSETRAMRSKEEAHDYRYFPEPDLPPLIVSDEFIERVRQTMPELPEARRKRFMEQYELSFNDAS